MKKRHVLAVALLIGIGTALGTFAVTRTSELGVHSRAASKKVTDTAVSAQTRRLNALEASLQKALATKPPALPRIPKIRPAPQTSRVIYSAAPAPTTRVFVRSTAPAPARAAAPSASHREQDHHPGSGGENDD